LKTDENFKPVIANTMFFTSLSFYFQLSNEKKELLNDAIKYAEESLVYNPNLSQSHYHLAKYYSLQGDIDKMSTNIIRAIELDKNYAIEVNSEKTFDNNRNKINQILSDLRDNKEKEAIKIIESLNAIFISIPKTKIENTIYFNSYLQVKTILDDALDKYSTKTYFGYIESIIIGNAALQKCKLLHYQSLNFIKTLEEKEKNRFSNSVKELSTGILVGGFWGLIAGLIIGIPGYIVVAIKENGSAGSSFFSSAIVICIISGIIIGVIYGFIKGPKDYQNYLNSKSRKR
jgi:tetratricopeptide (TPR) repeat protein